METIVLDGQSLFDLAIQMGGSVESVFDLAVAQNMSITDLLEVGHIVEPISASDKRVFNYYQLKNITPATGDIELNEGIEFWYVEYDFIVS